MSPPGAVIEPEHLSQEIGSQRLAGASAVAGQSTWAHIAGTLAQNIETVERTIIAATLEKTAYNISEAARLLGLTRRGLYLKMARLGLAGADS